ncbi:MULTISPECIES: hypothetical protein [unclassified Streptomyces]|uniref:hypothetical protein n=1 Tax=unclassified Streptomyces TaxID=2593676 RepID=UPI00081D5810|nr:MULTISPECIES: hypothetical protein [unclassified Streptomyces]SCG08702.1 hypothetical protein GA0115259_113537 [Streptomyces sp. MnatMP-M17]
MSDVPETERDDCTDCFVLPGSGNTRISYLKNAGTVRDTWHTPDCPALAIMHINAEEGSRRIQEEEDWARGVFPAAHERLKQAAAAMPAGTAARPFIDALAELVQAQADATGFVVLPRWAEILERHFPPELPDPDHITD